MATSSRSVNTNSRTSAADGHLRHNLPRIPARAAGRGRRGTAAPEGCHDRRRLQGAAPGVPRDLDLEDPLPGGPEVAVSPADAGRLPALHAGRYRAAAYDPAPAARRVPAAASDPLGARG